MRIAHLSAQSSPLLDDGADGAREQSVQVAAVARALGAAGHLVYVFTRREDLWSAPVVELGSNVLVMNVQAGPPHSIADEALLPHADDFATRVAGVCAAQERIYDVVHAHSFMSGIAALRIKRRFGIPFVMTFHGLEGSAGRDAGPFPAERTRIERELAAAADRVIAGSRSERDELVTGCGVDPMRIDVITAGFDASALAAGGNVNRAALGLRDPAFVALHVGELTREAGADTAIRAIARLKYRHGIAAHLLITAGPADVLNSRIDVGLAREIDRLRAIAAAAGVGVQVSFIAHPGRAARRESYRTADVVIASPSRAPYGTAAIEALACGIPVVGTDVGAIRDAVVDDVTGYLVPPGDPDAIADRLARLHANRERGRAYGRAGIMRMRAGFTWQHAAARLARGYVAVLEPHHARLAAAVSGR